MQWKKILGIGLLLIVAVVVTVYVFLATYDYNKLKPRLARMVRDATGRELRLGGELELAVGWSPTLVVTDVALSNAAWGSQPQMIEIEELKLQVRLWPLVFRDVDVNQIGLEGAKVLLETGPDGRSNWDFLAGQASGGSGAKLPEDIEVDRVSIANLEIAFFRHQTESKTHYRIASLMMNRRGTEDELTLNLQGDYNGTPVALDGTIGSLRQLCKRERLSVQLQAKSSSVTASISGAIDDIHALAGFDLQLDGSGQDLSEIGTFIGQALPVTDRFALKGRLTGAAPALTLKDAQGSARRGSLRFAVSGAVQDFFRLGGMDLQSRLTGRDLTAFGDIIGVKLPSTDGFEIQGRLTGSTDKLALQAATAGAERGSMRLALTGQVIDLLTLEGVDLQSRLTGTELAEIGPLVGAALPELGAFDLQGNLKGSSEALSLEPLEAVIDQSDFNGRATVAFLDRPKFTVRLDSSVIDFSALLKSLEKDKPKPAQKEKQGRRLFSDAPLPLDALTKVDADIVLKAKNIQARDARLETGDLTLKLEDHELKIDKFEATYKGTKMSGHLHIVHGQPPRVATEFLVQNFNLGDFLKETGKSDEVRAVIDIAAHGQSRGNSVRALMANLDGAIGAIMGQGYLTHYLDLLAAGLSQKVIRIWDPPKAADQIECAVVQFDFKKGVAVNRAFVFDTRAGIIVGGGEVNLGNEKIDFFLVPKSRHPDLRLVSRLKVSGTIMEPQVSVAKLASIARGAAGLSALVVGPVGLLAPFAHLGAHKAHPCDVKGIGQGGLDIPAEDQAPSPSIQSGEKAG